MKDSAEKTARTERTQNQAILFELLRSFTTLAKTLNLSRAVAELGTTRQTIRRHLNILEEARGEALFAVEDRQYRLTEAGRLALGEAQDLLARGEAWFLNYSGHVDGLFHIKYDPPDGQFYFGQQHPISHLWSDGSEVVKAAVKAWSQAEGDLEHDAMDEIRAHALVFRKHGKDWIFTEVGEKSLLAQWYGWTWARSTVGRPLGAMPGGPAYGSMMLQPFDDIESTKGLRYDHVFSTLAYGEEKLRRPAAFERLMLGAKFPDGSFALVSVVVARPNVAIYGVSPAYVDDTIREFEQTHILQPKED